MKINPDDPAFPLPSFGEPGLTIRAELAARAMQGLLASREGSSLDYEQVASEAVRCADALIAELNKE